MSEQNGVPILRIGRKGMKTYAFGEDGAPFTIDVTQVHNDWLAIDASFRDDKGLIPAEKRDEMNMAARQFVEELSKTPDLNLTEVLEFLKELALEASRLADFFVLKSSKEPPSAESTAVRFST